MNFKALTGVASDEAAKNLSKAFSQGISYLSSASVPIFQPETQTKKKHVSNTYIFERAFLPRLMKEVSGLMFKLGDTKGHKIGKRFHDDAEDWLNLAYNKTQFSEVKFDVNNTMMGLFDAVADNKSGSIRTTKIVMVAIGLCQLADYHDKMLFTDRFNEAFNDLLKRINAEAKEEMNAVEKSAQKALGRALKYLHSKYKFTWMTL
tara:strand:- start:81 stop:695 length:615 start_codon:yes stop_codon:yes gene_type:complete